MIRISKDTPKELIALVPRLKFNGTKEQVSQKVKKLKQFVGSNKLIKQFIKKKAKRPTNVVEIDGDAKFQPLATYISWLDFSKVPKIAKPQAMAQIENYLRQNGFLG